MNERIHDRNEERAMRDKFDHTSHLVSAKTISTTTDDIWMGLSIGIIDGKILWQWLNTKKNSMPHILPFDTEFAMIKRHFQSYLPEDQLMSSDSRRWDDELCAALASKVSHPCRDLCASEISFTCKDIAIEPEQIKQKSRSSVPPLDILLAIQM